MAGPTVLKSISNDRFFEKLFHAILFTLRVFARNLQRGCRRRSTFCILFWCLAWGWNLGFTSNRPTLYLLDHGGFKTTLTFNIIIIIYKHNWCIRTLQSGLRPSFTHHWCESQLKVDSERQSFNKLFMTILFTLKVFGRNLLIECPQRNIFVLMSDLWLKPRLYV